RTPLHRGAGGGDDSGPVQRVLQRQRCRGGTRVHHHHPERGHTPGRQRKQRKHCNSAVHHDFEKRAPSTDERSFGKRHQRNPRHLAHAVVQQVEAEDVGSPDNVDVTVKK
ncbi:MAG: hypothetical protein ACK55I_31530, partial [bacterium]